MSLAGPAQTGIRANPGAPGGERELLDMAMALRTSASRVTEVPFAAAVVPMSVLLSNMCTLSRYRFTFNSDPVPASYVMGPTGMLSCIAWSAQETGLRLLDADLACTLRRDERALFGLRAVVPPVTGNLADIVRGLVFMHSARTLFPLRGQEPVEIAQVFEAYEHAFRDVLAQPVVESGEIAWPQPFRQH